MAEIIRLDEIRIERARSSAREAERRSLKRAVELLEESLALAAGELRDASAGEKLALLDRIEKLVALVRYGRLMLGEPDDPGVLDLGS